MYTRPYLTRLALRTATCILVCTLLAAADPVSTQPPHLKIDLIEQERLNTALFTAIKLSKTWKVDPKDTEKILSLLEQGADPNARDMASLHPSRRNPHPTLSQAATPLGMLIRRKAWVSPPKLDEDFEPEIVDIAGLPGVAKENLTVVKALIDHGADVNAEYGKYRSTALLDAVQIGRYEATVRLLLEKGAKVEARDWLGRTPLMLVANGATYLNPFTDEPVKRLQLLLEHGADVNATDLGGYTPLMLACRRRAALEYVKILVKAGANLNLRANDGKTALKSAEEQIPVYGPDGYWEVVQYLKQAGAKE